METDLIAALAADDESTRLKAALAIGSNPDPALLDTLVARCAIEPNFYVRDMLTWALTRLPSDITLPKLLAELAVALVPQGQEKNLAEELATQLGRGDRKVQLSLSRAFVALGEEAVGPILRKAQASNDPAVRAHASATEQLLRDPDAGSELAVEYAKRIFTLGKE